MADIKITGLPALAATPDDADILEIVDDVAGTPTSKKITVANLKAAAPQGDVTAAANITDEALAVGDGGAKGIKVLALGAANLKLFVNAAGNANEYASGFKIGTFTRDTAVATGTQAITGLGFKPSHVIFLVSTSNTAQVSIGFDSGSLAYCVQNKQGVAADTWGIDTTYSILLFQTDVKYYAGKLTALGSDGFTVSWVKEGDKTGTATISYMAFR